MLVGMGHRSVLISGLVRNRLSMLLLNVHRTISRDLFLRLFEEGAFTRCLLFLRGSIFNKTAFVVFSF